MKKFACLMGLLVIISFTAKAQDNPKAEVFGGYSYLRFSPGDGASSINFNGGIGSVAYNVTNMIGVVGEFAGYHASNVEGSSVSVNSVSYLFGPKVSKSMGKITPFGQALFGGSHASCGSCESASSANGFTMALGGGLDYNVSRRFAVRVGQIDYVMSRYSVIRPASFSSSNLFSKLQFTSGAVTQVAAPDFY
jgi:outer membrane immunogenic protein